MLNELKEKVLQANRDLPKHDLIKLTWGNVSAINESRDLVVIKASGVPYDELTIDHMVVVDLDGNVVDGDYRPSSDLPTHLKLYQEWSDIGGIVHTHSTYATSFAQAGLPIPCYGTTHADYFRSDIPCTRSLTAEEISGQYEANTAIPIIEAFAGRVPHETPGVIVRNHGVFTWGIDAAEAVMNSITLEELARMSLFTKLLNPHAPEAPLELQQKHYFRKHGKDAYYGQSK